MRRKYCEGGRRKREIEILSDGVPRLCRIREENANWRTLAKLLYNRQPWRNNEPCIGEPSAAPSPLYLSLSLTSLLPASGERVTFALWPGKRGGGGKKVAFIFIAFESWRRVKFGGGRHRTLWLANEKKPSLILLVLLYKGGNAIQCYIGTRPSRALSRFHTVSASRGDLSHRGTFRSNRELFETVLRRERRAIRSLFPF